MARDRDRRLIRQARHVNFIFYMLPQRGGGAESTSVPEREPGTLFKGT